MFGSKNESVPMRLLLSNNVPSRVRSTSLSSVYLVVFCLFISVTHTVFAKSPFEDAACNDLRIRLDTKFSRLSERELNFALFDVADLGCTSEIERLLQAGADINARDRAGNTAFLLSSRKGHTNVMEILVEAGADIHQKNLNGSGALLMAVVSNRRKSVKALLDLGLDPNQGNKHALTPLIGAVYNGNKRLSLLLLDAGADPSAIDSTGKGPVIYAAGKGYYQLVELLLEADRLDVNKAYGNNLTALMWAAGYSNDVPEKDGLKSLAIILEAGANLNVLDNRGKTALHIAAGRDHLGAVEMLLDSGADTEILDKDGKTAAQATSSEEIKALLE